MSSQKIVQLERAPDADTIRILEELLVDAKSGKVVGLAALSFELGGSRQWRSGWTDRAGILWAFEHFKHLLLNGG